jgi:cytochrome c oxidase assembly protein subunit 15
LWLGLLAIQFALGATIIWTNKAADVATAHVGVGALSLLTGTLLILVSRKLSVTKRVRSAQPVVPALVGSVAR